jgi:hypothetical protein
MLKKLLAVESIQARIDLVAADYESGRDIFARIDAVELLEALGEDSGEGEMRQYCFHESYRNDCSWYVDAAEWLSPYVSPARLAELEILFERMENRAVTEDAVILSPYEEGVLQVLHDTHRCENQFAEFAIRSWSVEATDGTVLSFQGEVGDGGEVTDVLGPYELRKGYPKIGGIDFDHYASGTAAAKLRKYSADSND